MISFLLWYLLLSLAGWIVFPLAYRMLSHLHDRGLALARPLGLILWGFVFWLLTSLGVLQNDPGGILLALGLVAGCSVWAGRGYWGEMLAWLKQNIRTVIMIEALFLLAFAAWAVVRAANPEIQYTEKTMELAFINSIMRSPQFPPRDPWLAGYAISYYHFGYVLVAMLARLAGIEGSVAFNLALASWFALTAVGAFGIVYTLLARWWGGDLSDKKASGSARWWALLSPLFILVLSNLEGFLAMLHARGLFWKAGPDGSLTSGFWTWLGIQDLNMPPSQPLGWQPHPGGGWPWWRASRVLSDFKFDRALGPQEVIDEFPFFSYLLGDLHPHVLSMPFVLVAVGLALNLYIGTRRSAPGSFSWLGWLQRADFWLAAVVLGSLAFLNTWDFPIYVALFSAASAFAVVQQRGLGNPGKGSWLGDFLRLAVLVGVVGVVLYLPFYLGFRSQAGGILPSLIFFTPGKNFWVMFATLLLPILAWLVYRWRNQGGWPALKQGLTFAVVVVFGLWIASLLFGLLIVNLGSIGAGLQQTDWGANNGMAAKMMQGAATFMGVQGAQSGQETALLLESFTRRLTSPGTWLSIFALLTLTWGLIAGRRRLSVSRAQMRYDEQVLGAAPIEGDPRSSGFVLLLVLLGLGLAVFPEFFYLRDLFGMRMNTIFKFYFQAWILFGLAGAYASAVILRDMRGLVGWLIRIGWLVLMIMGLTYPYWMLPAKTNNFNPVVWTLDGAEYIQRTSQGEKAAMDWLRQAPVGVLAEGVTGSYDYGRLRFSVFSGQPAVLGWPFHELQWGRGDELGSREIDMEQLYTTTDWNVARAILRSYGIRYVAVGPTERSLYNNPDKGLRLSEEKFQNFLTPVFSNESVVIYETPQDYWQEGLIDAWK